MKTYISNIIPRIKQFSRELNDLTILENQHWVIIDEATQTKQVFIFRKNSELLIATNGRVKKGRWEYLNNSAILIEKEEDMFLLKHDFIDNDILALKLDSNNEYIIFINESKYGQELNDIESVNKFLEIKYLDDSSKRLHGSSEAPVLLDNYSAPPYRKTLLKTIEGFWTKTTIFRINYDDGSFGFLYEEEDGHAYFEDVVNDSRVFYKNFESAVTAMYVYKRRGILVSKDRYKTRFLSSSLDKDMERSFGKE